MLRIALLFLAWSVTTGVKIEQPVDLLVNLHNAMQTNDGITSNLTKNTVVVDAQHLTTLRTLQKKHPIRTKLYRTLGLNGPAEDVIKAFKTDGQLLAKYREYGDSRVIHAVSPDWLTMDVEEFEKMPRSIKLKELTTMYYKIFAAFHANDMTGEAELRIPLLGDCPAIYKNEVPTVEQFTAWQKETTSDVGEKFLPKEELEKAKDSARLRVEAERENAEAKKRADQLDLQRKANIIEVNAEAMKNAVRMSFIQPSQLHVFLTGPNVKKAGAYVDILARKLRENEISRYVR